MYYEIEQKINVSFEQFKKQWLIYLNLYVIFLLSYLFLAMTYKRLKETTNNNYSKFSFNAWVRFLENKMLSEKIRHFLHVHTL